MSIREIKGLIEDKVIEIFSDKQASPEALRVAAELAELLLKY